MNIGFIGLSIIVLLLSLTYPLCLSHEGLVEETPLSLYDGSSNK